MSSNPHNPALPTDAQIETTVARALELIQKKSREPGFILSPATPGQASVTPSTDASPGTAGAATALPVPGAADAGTPPVDLAAELASLRAEKANLREEKGLVGFLKFAGGITGSGNPNLLVPADDIAVLLATKGFAFDHDDAGESVLRRGDEVLPITSEGLEKAGVPLSFLGTSERGGTGSHGGTVSSASAFRPLSDREYGRLSTAEKRKHQLAAYAAAKGNL